MAIPDRPTAHRETMRPPLGAILVCTLASCLPTLGACDKPGGAGDRSRNSSAQQPADQGLFVDITAAVGIDFRIDRAQGRYFMPDSMAGGCALLDYDNDGRLDVYVVNGYWNPTSGGTDQRGANRLYRQTAGGRFDDVTTASGLGDPAYGMGVAVGDIDNDGDVDVFLANYGPDALYRNNGDGTFANITVAAGIRNDRWSASAGFFDYDADGYLDLFVTNYLDFDSTFVGADDAGRPEYPGVSRFSGVADVLLHNNGDGTFTDVSKDAGIADARGRGLGVVFADLDGDGRVDIYVANDREANHAWLQQGLGVFQDRAGPLGLALNFAGEPEASMGIAPGDFDGDGLLDLFLTHFVQETNTLYRGRGRGAFDDRTPGSGLGAASVDTTAFGTVPLDYDHDGDLDLLCVNGRVVRILPHPGAKLDAHWNPYAEPNQLFENLGDGRFKDVSATGGSLCTDVEVSRGLAVGDIDGDGDLDVLLSNANGTVRLFRNDAPKKGHWLIVRAVDPRLRRDAYGAVVTVTAGGRVWRRDVQPAYSYLSSNDPRTHFGLGGASQIDSIKIAWPDGMGEVFEGCPVDRVVELRRGDGRGA